MREIMYLGFGALFVEIGVARGPSSSSSVSSPAAFLGVVLRRCGGSFCCGGFDAGVGLMQIDPGLAAGILLNWHDFVV